jgi:hypothetical protein
MGFASTYLAGWPLRDLARRTCLLTPALVPREWTDPAKMVDYLAAENKERRERSVCATIRAFTM